MQIHPKYYQIKQELVENIKKGKYPPNTKIPSLRELMKQYNIANATAARTINELVNEGIAYTVQGKGCFVSAPKKNSNEISQYIQNKRIAFIWAINPQDKFLNELVMGIFKVVQSKDYVLEVYTPQKDYTKEMQTLNKFIENPPAGIIFMPAFYNENYSHLFHLQKKNIPVVLACLRLRNHDLDWVGCNEREVTKNTVKYLIKLGHKKIAYLGCDENNSGGSLHLLEGYIKALREKKIKINPELILYFDTKNGDGISIDCGYKLTNKFLSKKKKFTAIVAYNDEMAIGAYRALKEKGIRVPEDVSIIGFDDLDIARNLEVPLTTVHQDIVELGAKSAKLLFKRIESRISGKTKELYQNTPEKIFTKTKLIIRDSVRKLDNN